MARDLFLHPSETLFRQAPLRSVWSLYLFFYAALAKRFIWKSNLKYSLYRTKNQELTVACLYLPVRTFNRLVSISRSVFCKMYTT